MKEGRKLYVDGIYSVFPGRAKFNGLTGMDLFNSLTTERALHLTLGRIPTSQYSCQHLISGGGFRGPPRSIYERARLHYVKLPSQVEPFYVLIARSEQLLDQESGAGEPPDHIVGQHGPLLFDL